MTSALTDTVTNLNHSFVRMLDWNRSFFEKTWRVTQEESLSLINRRLEHTARALENLRETQGVSGLLAVEQDWLVDTARDYIESGEKLRGRLFDLASVGAQEAAEKGRESYESLRATAQRTAEEIRQTAETQRHAAE